MWPYSWTHVGTPSHLGHMDRVAATMPSQAHAGAAQEAPNIGQWEGQDVPLVRPSSCLVKGGILSSRRYLPTYLPRTPVAILGLLGVCIYVPASRHWLISYSHIHHLLLSSAPYSHFQVQLPLVTMRRMDDSHGMQL